VHQLGRSLQLSKNKRKRGVFKQKKRGTIDPSTLSLLYSLFYKIKTKTKHTGLLYFYGHVHTHTHMRGSTHTQASSKLFFYSPRQTTGWMLLLCKSTHRQTHTHAEFNCAASRKCHISGRVRLAFFYWGDKNKDESGRVMENKWLLSSRCGTVRVCFWCLT
jgi:hypothetical protein